MSWPDSVVIKNAADLRSFGETVQYQSAGGGAAPVDISVVWSDGDASLPPGVRATAWTLESNFDPLPSKGDLVTRGSNRYQVVSPQKNIAHYESDGYGGLTLYLRQISRTPDV